MDKYRRIRIIDGLGAAGAIVLALIHYWKGEPGEACFWMLVAIFFGMPSDPRRDK